MKQKKYRGRRQSLWKAEVFQNEISPYGKDQIQGTLSKIWPQATKQVKEVDVRCSLRFLKDSQQSLLYLKSQNFESILKIYPQETG